MERDDSVYIKHIRDAILKIQSYTKKFSAASFKKDSIIQDAVIRQIEIIGEATKRLSDKIRSENDDVPWEDIAGMRDKLIHDYFGVDIEKVWLTVQTDIPPLKKQISRISKSFWNSTNLRPNQSLKLTEIAVCEFHCSKVQWKRNQRPAFHTTLMNYSAAAV